MPVCSIRENREEREKILWFLLLAALFCLISISEMAGAAQKEGSKIRITADSMEALDQKGTVVFTGNVVTKRGDLTIYSDRLEVYYQQKPADKGKAKRDGSEGTEDKGTASGKSLKKIVAKGHVKLVQGKRRAVAQKAVYFKKSEVIVLTGNAQVWDGPNTIKGDLIRFYINENRSVVKGGKGRVEAVVYSDE